MLPDSNTNELLSHGFIKYRIKPLQTLLAGDSIKNKAHIYFDFNAPVETNLAITKIVLPTAIENGLTIDKGQVAIFPNPTENEINIHLSASIIKLPNNPISISVFDVMGNKVLHRQSVNANCTLPTANLTYGIYFVEIATGFNMYRTKFVKQ